MEAPLSSRKTHPVFGVGEVEASRCVDGFGSLLIVVFGFLLKIAQICQLEASVLFSHTQTAFGSLLFMRPFVVSD